MKTLPPRRPAPAPEARSRRVCNRPRERSDYIAEGAPPPDCKPEGEREQQRGKPEGEREQVRGHVRKSARG